MLTFIQSHLGETMALSTAFVWAIAVILFKKSGEHVHPIALNLFKGVLSALLLVPTIYLVGEDLFREVAIEDFLLILFSGALGIGIADTLFFKCLNLLGAGLSAIVDCLYSPFIIGLSMLWLGETMSALQLVGVVMIVSAVLSTTVESKNGQVSRHDMFWGIFYGALAMATMAVGIVMVKPLLTVSPLFWVTEVRVVGGIIVLGLILLVNPRRRQIIKSLSTAGSRTYTIIGSFLGGFVAMIMWLAGMKYIQASTASALNQTSAIFVFIFAAIFLKEPITLVRLIAILMGVGGLILVTLT